MPCLYCNFQNRLYQSFKSHCSFANEIDCFKVKSKTNIIITNDIEMDLAESFEASAYQNPVKEDNENHLEHLEIYYLTTILKLISKYLVQSFVIEEIINDSIHMIDLCNKDLITKKIKLKKLVKL